MSGSCEMKTCWNSAPPFREVGTLLKEKYENAAKVQVYEALYSVHVFCYFYYCWLVLESAYWLLQETHSILGQAFGRFMLIRTKWHFWTSWRHFGCTLWRSQLLCLTQLLFFLSIKRLQFRVLFWNYRVYSPLHYHESNVEGSNIQWCNSLSSHSREIMYQHLMSWVCTENLAKSKFRFTIWHKITFLFSILCRNEVRSNTRGK